MERALHVWEVPGFINVTRKTKTRIKRFILKKYSSFRKAFKTLGLGRGAIQNFLGKSTSFTTPAKFFTLTDGLEILREEAEKWIKEFKDSNNQHRSYRVNFPFTYTPLVLRTVAHTPGDGCVGERSGEVVWTQKVPKFMTKLLKKLLTSRKALKMSGASVYKITIPKFLVKVNCLILRIVPSELKSQKFVHSVMDLPRQYKVQALLALIVDEGAINPRGEISIVMKKRSMVKAYAELCDSLGYSRSRVKRVQYNSKFGLARMWKFRILADGIREIYKDYVNTLEAFGRVGGLWDKDKKFIKRCQLALSRKAVEDAKGRKMTKIILSVLPENGALSTREIYNLIGSDSYDRVRRRVQCLKEAGVLTRTRRCTYALA